MYFHQHLQRLHNKDRQHAMLYLKHVQAIMQLLNLIRIKFFNFNYIGNGLRNNEITVYQYLYCCIIFVIT